MTANTTNKFWTAAAILVAWAISVGLPIASHAQQTDRLAPRSLDARQYDSCMALTKNDPKSAHDSALAWHKKGGGDAAVHCVAASLLGLGQHVQAGQMLEELASRTDTTRGTLKAGLLGQAANAWLIAGKPAQSETLLTDALRLAPQDVELLVDRSVARATLGKYWDALDDLNAALERDPSRADALTYRASAWRRVAALDLAEKDVVAALNRRPDYPEGLLERGLIRKARGNATGARADWLRVLEIAVDGPLTEAARRNLEILDVKKR
jgi:tetratricopeptide (TPR) repeat protein